MKKLLFIPILFISSLVYGELGGSYARSVFVRQNVSDSTVNSSTKNLSAGATFTGSSATTLGVNAIQVSLKTDQNCTVYVEQSPDGTNWDLVDIYNYWASINNFGITVQAVNSYVRVRVKNISTTDTTYFRLQTVLCPIVEALPRSLDEEGHLITVSKGIEDDYGFKVENTAMGEMRTVTPTMLVGKVWEGTIIDPNFSVSSTSILGSTITQANGTLIFQTSTTETYFGKLWSARRARYTSGQMLGARFQMILSSGIENNYRRWGVAWGASTPTITDGALFSLKGTTFCLGTWLNGKETCVNSGNFNGKLGGVYNTSTTLFTTEIYWTNKSVYFVVDDKILHRVTASTEPNMGTMQLRIYFANENVGVTASSTTMACYVASIRRFGQLLTQPVSRYVSGQQTQILKYGTGNLHEVVLSGVVNNSVVTIYDNTSATGEIIWSSGAMGAQTIPISVDLKGLPFFNGLTIAITGANSNALVVYE